MAKTPVTVPFCRCASLRLRDRTATDWSFDAEGSLILYDPAQITAKEFDAWCGMQQIIGPALGWMVGQGGGMSLVNAPEHWSGLKADYVAEQVAAMVGLGWRKTITVLPFRVACNGFDVHCRTEGLSGEERIAHREHHRRTTRGRSPEPFTTWLNLTSDRLALTWTFMFGFTMSQKKKLFNAGHTVEVPLPRGEYQIRAWSMEAAEVDGLPVDQAILQFMPNGE